mmetsp:Transcript_89113/g.191212  ORF Transcript_89113/g.191212 Transcript_89113/m.191212 type:complete len:279 (-) Transcript_89113:162-998(-)
MVEDADADAGGGALSFDVTTLDGRKFSISGLFPTDHFQSLLCRVADKLDVDAGDVEVCRGCTKLEAARPATLGELGLSGNSGPVALVAIVQVSEMLLEPRCFRMFGILLEEMPWICDPPQGIIHGYINDYRLRRRTLHFARDAALSRTASDPVSILVYDSTVTFGGCPDEEDCLAYKLRPYDIQDVIHDDQEDLKSLFQLEEHGQSEANPLGIMDSRRRTVAFAQQAAEDRERRLQRLVVDGPGICVGSAPPEPGDAPPDASWHIRQIVGACNPSVFS